MPQVLNQTYDQLVEKAQLLFWTKGYKGVNAKELAEYLDVSTSVIYNKYTKDMLFLDSIKYYTTMLIDALLDQTFPTSCLMVNTVVELRNSNQDIVKRYKTYFDTLGNSYKVVLDKAIESGEIKYPEKRDEYAEFLLGIIFSMSILYKIEPKEKLRKYIDEQLSFII